MIRQTATDGRVGEPVEQADALEEAPVAQREEGVETRAADVGGTSVGRVDQHEIRRRQRGVVLDVREDHVPVTADDALALEELGDQDALLVTHGAGSGDTTAHALQVNDGGEEVLLLRVGLLRVLEVENEQRTQVVDALDVGHLGVDVLSEHLEPRVDEDADRLVAAAVVSRAVGGVAGLASDLLESVLADLGAQPDVSEGDVLLVGVHEPLRLRLSEHLEVLRAPDDLARVADRLGADGGDLLLDRGEDNLRVHQGVAAGTTATLAATTVAAATALLIATTPVATIAPATAAVVVEVVEGEVERVVIPAESLDGGKATESLERVDVAEEDVGQGALVGLRVFRTIGGELLVVLGVDCVQTVHLLGRKRLEGERRRSGGLADFLLGHNELLVWSEDR